MTKIKILIISFVAVIVGMSVNTHATSFDFKNAIDSGYSGILKIDGNKIFWV